MNKTIAVDFDGVIHRYSNGWQGGVIYDPPVEGAFEAIRKLLKEGYNVVIHTTRADTPERIQDVIDWLVTHGAEDLTPLEITATKPKAIVYIDDRAVRFTNWDDIRKLFT